MSISWFPDEVIPLLQQHLSWLSTAKVKSTFPLKISNLFSGLYYYPFIENLCAGWDLAHRASAQGRGREKWGFFSFLCCKHTNDTQTLNSSKLYLLKTNKSCKSFLLQILNTNFCSGIHGGNILTTIKHFCLQKQLLPMCSDFFSKNNFTTHFTNWRLHTINRTDFRQGLSTVSKLRGLFQHYSCTSGNAESSPSSSKPVPGRAGVCTGALGQEVVMISKELLCSFMGIINVQCNLVYPKGSGDT